MPFTRPNALPPGRSRALLTSLLLLAMLFAVLFPSIAAADSEEPWKFEGGGWGHGIGMSQFGALGQADDGRTVADILAFYYEGSSVASMPADHWTRQPDGLWVGIVSNTNSVKLEAEGSSMTVCQPLDCSHAQQEIALGETWLFEANSANSSECRLRHQSVAPHPSGYGPCQGIIENLAPGSRAKIGSREYARGSVRFDPAAGGFHAVVTVDIEEYLYGLSEVPSSWNQVALQVQAIAGRTYAAATAIERGGANGAGKLASCGCHLLPTTLDQAYTGWSKENPANGGANWTAAVDATDRQVVTHPESESDFDIAKTFYSSSNGGASEDNEDVWGGAPVPWLRSVPDPWSANPAINPLAQWTIHVEDAAMAQYLGWDRALDAFVLEGPPGVRVKFTGKKDRVDVSKTLSGTQIRTLLNSIGTNPGGGSVRVSPYVSAVIDPPGFDDIVGHLFESDIDWILGEGITKGCNPPANTLYCPEDDVSREVMAAFLSRALNLPATGTDFFTDDDNSIFENDINRLAAAGITKGCGGTRFCPNEVVDRGQMAAFLVRALGLSNAGGGDLFLDDDGSIFEHDIDVLGTAGITKGCNPPANDRFCPNLPVDRGAMAAFLHRSLDP